MNYSLACGLVALHGTLGDTRMDVGQTSAAAGHGDISYPTIPYHTIPYLTIPYHTIPYLTIP